MKKKLKKLKKMVLKGLKLRKRKAFKKLVVAVVVALVREVLKAAAKKLMTDGLDGIFPSGCQWSPERTRYLGAA